MLTVKELIAVLKMERSIGPKACGCSASRDCAHDGEPRFARAVEPTREGPGARVEVLDPVTGEVLYVPVEESDP